MNGREDILIDAEQQVEGAMELTAVLDRLSSAAARLEQTLDRLTEKQGIMAADAEACIGRVVATVEARRETELEQKLAAAEAEIAELRATAKSVSTPGAHPHSGRKTVPATMVSLLAKQGVTMDSLEAGAVDSALGSLSIEQRIAVKAQLMRAGLIG